MRPALLDTAGYQPQTIEKVERLLEFLAEASRHPFLAPRLRLHGGTALNVFHLPLPRLSVDADLTYMGRVPLEEFRSERPQLEEAVADLASGLGYNVTTTEKVEHSGRTFKLRYRYLDQPDLIKVDLIYLNRTPLLDTELATCTACSPETTVLTLALPELLAGKTKALFDRVAVRDLYDVYRIEATDLAHGVSAASRDAHQLQRRVRLYYVSLSMPFPCPVDGSVVEKFLRREQEVERDLYPMLHVADRPGLGEMMDAAARFISGHVAPREDEEREYLRRLDEESRYSPELLFSRWPDVLARAQESPAARWKVVNLRKRPAEIAGDYPEW